MPDMVEAAVWLNRAGLAFNFIGSVLIVFSVGRPPSDVYQIDRGQRVNFAAFSHPWALPLGLAILIVGFALSFVATWL